MRRSMALRRRRGAAQQPLGPVGERGTGAARRFHARRAHGCRAPVALPWRGRAARVAARGRSGASPGPRTRRLRQRRRAQLRQRRRSAGPQRPLRRAGRMTPRAAPVCRPTPRHPAATRGRGSPRRAAAARRSSGLGRATATAARRTQAARACAARRRRRAPRQTSTAPAAGAAARTRPPARRKAAVRSAGWRGPSSTRQDCLQHARSGGRMAAAGPRPERVEHGRRAGVGRGLARGAAPRLLTPRPWPHVAAARTARHRR